ncbi:MAG: pilus assembly protein N-terminal domain-containing protein [Gammaproteobacteria bacterium]|nr:pilus assembly protein N-terminal domain-containing protein [Gammaproteobacteria bacterium]
MKNRFLIFLVFIMGYSVSLANVNSYFMFVGEVKIYKIDEPVDRVAVGNGKLLSSSITKEGQLILIAEGRGDTNIHIWLRNGKERKLKVFVREKDTNRQIHEIKVALSNIKGLKIHTVGETIQISGNVESKYKPIIEKLEKKYKFLNLVEYDSFGDTYQKIKMTLLNIIPGLDISRIENSVIIKGEVEKKFQPLISVVMEAFKGIQILNLTNEASVAQGKMINMAVKITEFGNNDLNELGVNWQSQVDGAVLSYSDGMGLFGMDYKSQGIYQGGYFGIASAITSKINLLVANGDAVVLAEPHLSTYSGGNAEFLSGGELPIPVTDKDGSVTVEFKAYGILLKIHPYANAKGQISAHVETEISSIDSSVTVNGIPGMKTRKTSTNVLMRDKETLVISGLVSNEISKDINKVPLLGDIPILGSLFSSKKFRDNKTQLVIFVTPTTYDANSDFNKNSINFEAQLLNKFMSSIGEKEIVD